MAARRPGVARGGGRAGAGDAGSPAQLALGGSSPCQAGREYPGPAWPPSAAFPTGGLTSGPD